MQGLCGESKKKGVEEGGMTKRWDTNEEGVWEGKQCQRKRKKWSEDGNWHEGKVTSAKMSMQGREGELERKWENHFRMRNRGRGWESEADNRERTSCDTVWHSIYTTYQYLKSLNKTACVVTRIVLCMGIIHAAVRAHIHRGSRKTHFLKPGIQFLLLFKILQLFIII